jgi:hypothetical protein
MNRKTILSVLSIALCSAVIGVTAKDATTSFPDEVGRFIRERSRIWNSGETSKIDDIYSPLHETKLIFNGEAYSRPAQVKEVYKRTFIDDDGKPYKAISFSEIETMKLSNDFAFCTGKWKIEKDERIMQFGYFSSLLKRDKGEWRVVNEHLSNGYDPKFWKD